MMPLIFVIDPSAERRGLVQRTLEQAGYPVEVFATTQALGIAEQIVPSLIIVATELPDGNGIGLRNRVREHPSLSSTPVVLLADSRFHKSFASEGGDSQECLVFPFAPGELVEDVERLLQTTRAAAAPISSSEEIDIVIDPFAMKISVRGKEVTTTSLEFRLIDYLARHHGKVFSRDALLDAVWGDLRFVTPRSVDACIRRIRRKIEPESSSPRLLRTIRGTGYKLDAKPTWEAAGGACQCAICTAARSRATAAARRHVGDFNSLGRAGILPVAFKNPRLSS
jgi:two-component system phosphate regulon response regulator PhoB